MSERGARDDIRNLAPDPAAPERVNEFLRRCATDLGGPGSLIARFKESDDTATRHQRRYDQAAAFSALGGTASIALAIVQLAFHHALSAGWEEGRRAPAIILLGLEILAIGFTFFSVARSLVLYRQEGWLLWRYKAEQLRLLLYRLLTRPDYWSGREPAGGDYEQWIGREISMIEILTSAELHSAARSARMPYLPEPKECQGVDAADLEGLVSFYRRTRLSAQRAYFQERAKENPWSWDNPRLLPVFFFSSVGAVLLHFAFEIAAFAAKNPGSQTTLQSASVALLLVAALLPALWAGIRTWRSAHEFTRNAMRAAASLGVLTHYSEMLGREKDPVRLFTTLDLCESFLDGEQREWLRLMLEADWYG